MASKPQEISLSTFLVTSTSRIPQVSLRTYLKNLGEVLTIEPLRPTSGTCEVDRVALVKMAGIKRPHLDTVPPEHTLPAGKLRIEHLFSESTTFKLCGPAASILRSNVQQYATKWKLRCNIQDSNIVVTGPIENVYQFRLELDDYVKSQLAKGDPTIQSLLAEQSTSASHSLEAQGSSPEGGPNLNSGQKFTGLSPDVLSLLAKLPEGEIPGVCYTIEEGVVCIDTESKEELEDRISKFQEAYQNIVSSRRLKVEAVDVPAFLDQTQVALVVASFSEKYAQCVFTYLEEPRVIKVVSNSSRQFDQAKKLLHDQLRSPTHSPHPTPSPAAAMTEFSAHEVISLPHGRRFTLKKADIVKEQVDAIVNAANGRLLHGGGVAGALDAASHGMLQKYSDAYVQQKGVVPVGEIVVTHGGGGLKCKRVIHAVGPDNSFQPNECQRLLTQVVHNALITAEKGNAASIAFPAISSGIFGVNQDLVAATIINTILTHQFTKPPPVLSDIRIVIIDHPKHACFAHHFVQMRAHITQPVNEQPSESQSAGLGQFGGRAGDNSSFWSQPPPGGPAGGTTNQGSTHNLLPSMFHPTAQHQGGEPPPFSPPQADLPQGGASSTTDVVNSTKPSFMRQNSSPAAISPPHSPNGKLLTLADLQQLTTHLQSLRPKWKRLGIYLGLNPEILAQLSEGEAASDPSVCLERMLTMWLQHKGQLPTLEALLKALSSQPIGEHSLAQLLQGHANEYGLEGPAAGANPTNGVSYPALPSTTDSSGSTTDGGLSTLSLTTTSTAATTWPHTTTTWPHTTTTWPHTTTTWPHTTTTWPHTTTAWPHTTTSTAATTWPHTTTSTTATPWPYTASSTVPTVVSPATGVSVTTGVPVTTGYDPLSNFPSTSPNPLTTTTVTSTTDMKSYSVVAGGTGGDISHTKKTGGGQGVVTTQPHAHHGTGNVNISGKRNRSPSGGGTTAGATGGSHEAKKAEECPICLEVIKNPVRTGCGHVFCSACINRALLYDSYCPTCKKPLRTITGKQPRNGKMVWKTLQTSLPGYTGYKTIQITYDIPGGTQGQEHPNPGRPFTGAHRVAYLPDNREGREVLKLLKKAFDARLIFTVGTSVTTGEQNVVVWNDIHHKTNIHGGPQSYGYPDSTYLKRVKDDLAIKSIVSDSTAV